MPKRIPVTERDIAWLRDHIHTETYEAMAAKLNCCVDTLKRILVRQGLAQFDGAKYQVSRRHRQIMWARPCSVCKNTDPRPKWQFRCDNCHDHELEYSSSIDTI